MRFRKWLNLLLFWGVGVQVLLKAFFLCSTVWCALPQTVISFVLRSSWWPCGIGSCSCFPSSCCCSSAGTTSSSPGKRPAPTRTWWVMKNLHYVSLKKLVFKAHSNSIHHFPSALLYMGEQALRFEWELIQLMRCKVQ